MASGYEMRVGDAEREAAAAELREHYASGRLTHDELNERLDKAFAAKTRADLNAVMTDLPSARPGWAAGARPGEPAGIGAPGAGGSGAPQGGPARMAGAVLAALVVMCALLAFGFLGVFGIGTGRPFGLVLIFAALALLRRLFFGRRRGRACGPRGRRRW